MLKAGDVIRYGYLRAREAAKLWAREAAKGGESGRKARPACIVVCSASQPSALFAFPLTSQEPGSDRTCMAVTEIECRRGGLDDPSFLILDE